MAGKEFDHDVYEQARFDVSGGEDSFPPGVTLAHAFRRYDELMNGDDGELGGSAGDLEPVGPQPDITPGAMALELVGARND